MNQLKIQRLGYALGARVTGVDFSKPLEADTIAEIRRAWLDHIVLSFPDQPLSSREMRAACLQFGEPDDNQSSAYREPNTVQSHRFSEPGTMIIDGEAVPGRGIGRAAQWHSDLSHTGRPATITFLVAKDLPDVGGETMWANQYAAYDALSPAFKELIEPLSAVYDVSLLIAYATDGPELQAKARERNPLWVHPVVHVHPETGRKALFVDSRTRKFVGMTEEESNPLLGFIREHVTRYEFVYRHRWTVNELVLWDNRCALHFAVEDWDKKTQVRRMLRCSLRGPAAGHAYEGERGSEAALIAGAR